MPIVHLLGAIVPAGTNISLTGIPGLIYESPENDLKASFTFQITNSVVDVECNLSRFDRDPGFLALIHKPAFDSAQALVSLVSFSTGIGLALVFDRFIDPNGVETVFRPEDKGLASLCTAFDATSGLCEAIKIVLSDFSLCIALNELIEAITLTHHAVASCTRSIERLRHAMSPGLERKHAWAQFRSNLQISKDYLEFITGYSTGARHGDPTFISGPITREVTRRSWIIMNRFLEYRKRGNAMLPVSEFPLL